MEFGNILSWFKLSPRYLLAIVFITSFFIFNSDKLLLTLGVLEIKNSYLKWFSLTLVISSSLLLSYFIEELYVKLKQKLKNKQNLSMRQSYLHKLTTEEKEVLNQYIKNNTKSRLFSITNGVISGLVVKRILFQSTGIGGMSFEFSFNIQQWAWEYLNKKPELLS